MLLSDWYTKWKEKRIQEAIEEARKQSYEEGYAAGKAGKEHIRSALAAIPTDDFRQTSQTLLATLGYRSERTLELSGIVTDFIQEFPAPTPNTKTEQAFRNDVESVQLLFQFTSDEVADNTQQTLDLDEAFLEEGWTESFLFFGVTLKEKNYSRSKYAELTREINKRLFAPTVVLFRVAEQLTIAFAGRRQHQYDESRDVLEQVTLIKDIRFNAPYRAHLDILSELSLEECIKWMDTNDTPKNFDGLLAAWLAKLDTEELNKQFYKQLFSWFEWAIQEAKFPTNETKTLSPQEHVIRLITRLLFIWFLKEKDLVAEELFSKAHVQSLLKADDFDTDDSYYRTVLQNLFFATLNTEISQRGFSQKTQSGHRNFSRYRYKAEIRDPDKLLSLFAKTPFINGGLFDCLDSEDATRDGGYRIDCFSDVHYDKLCIPNRLFFDEKQGLFPLLQHYKFTVEENTPIEQEVALDPELLGKVFENLLAAYNPETGATARKQTGSYYTPRAIVDYMVEEAVVATLAQRCEPTDGDAKLWNERLHYLLDYARMFDDANEFFDGPETERIVRAISELKILDPAVGSGAFPMGTLHKLTLALRRLDPDNTRWEQLQKERALQRADIAFDTRNDETRREELIDIDETFKRYRDSDFGRKLYLIQNSIFGVDIQPIACQIAKLRFFISLAIEQEPDRDADNFGIKPLPNLETRFLAANTLIGLEVERTLTSQKVQHLERELRDNRERHFHATTRVRKLACKRTDSQLRTELATELRSIGMPADDAEKLARWDPYDQNATAGWFDPEWMFGVPDGYDVVIGNPPYVESRNSMLSDEQKTAYGKQVVSDWKESVPRGSDLLIYFYARSPKFLNESGNGCFITQNAWLNTDYGHKFQKFSLNKFSFLKIIDTSSKFFSDSESQNINTIITLFTKKLEEDIVYGIADANMVIGDKKVIRSNQAMKWGHIFSMPSFYEEILSKMSLKPHTDDKISFGQGLNFPLNQLSDDSGMPIIVKSAQFVAVSTDKRISEELARKRLEKIPALVMPRGVGVRHYCTFNSYRAFSYSHVELYLPTNLWNSEMHYCLWVYLNSSFVWLFREITGRKNLGGGLLKAEATDMKMLPVNFNFDFADKAKGIFDSLKNREPMPVQKEVYTEEHLLIDDMIADYFGFQGRLNDIREALIEQVNFRLTRAKPKK